MEHGWVRFVLWRVAQGGVELEVRKSCYFLGGTTCFPGTVINLFHNVFIDGVKVRDGPDLKLGAVLERDDAIGGAADTADVFDALDVAVDDLGLVLALKAAANGNASTGELVAHPGGARHGGYERDDSNDG